MISTRWIEKRKPHWAKLEALLNQSSKSGLKSLSRSDLQELSLLYRQTAADLAAIREDRASVHFTRYVNQLLVRAHNTIYSGHKASPKAILSFSWETYPAAFRRSAKHCLLATVIFAVAGVVGAVLTYVFTYAYMGSIYAFIYIDARIRHEGFDLDLARAAEARRA